MHLNSDESAITVGSVTPFRQFIAKCSVWFGVVMALLGSVITFVPGGESGWFAIAAMFIGIGVFVPSRAYRVAAIVGCILCLLAAYDGYQRGVEYEEWLRQR